MIHDHTSLESPFTPDAILPVQYWCRRRLDDPWQRLMMAVLLDGVRCYQTNFTATTGERRLLFTDAEEWLFAPSDSGPFACDTVCHAIGIDPEYLRDGLTQWRGKQLEEPRATYTNRRVVRTSARRHRGPQARSAFARASVPYEGPAIEAGRSLRELASAYLWLEC
jgi:hypothetical protein